MIVYDCETVRRVLDIVTRGFENKLSDKQILKSLDIPGTKQDKERLIENCKIYLYLDQMFNSEKPNKSLAIKLASKYINNNRDKSNLIKEKLVSMYIRVRQYKKAEKLLNSFDKIDTENKRNFGKRITILLRQEKPEKALELIEKYGEKFKTDSYVFYGHYKALMNLERKDDAIKLLCTVGNIKINEKNEEKREILVNQLYRYLEDAKNYEGENKEQAIIALNYKIKYENYKNNTFKLDMERAEKINSIIFNARNNVKVEDLQNVASKIFNPAMKLIKQYQIDFAYGNVDKDTMVMRLEKHLKDEGKYMPETERQLLSQAFLKNFLKTRDANFYLHDKWIRFQNNNFYKLNQVDKENESR